MTAIARNCLVILVGALLAALLSACGSGNTPLNSSTNPSVFYSHSVALSNNTTFAWGANTYGQLGNGDTKGATQFVPVPVITGMTGVSAGGTHTLAFINGGSVFAWGNNGLGQLGNNSTNATATPVQVFTDTNGTPLTGVTAISAGFNHSLALSGGTVWAWGSNSEGQLGLDPTAGSSLARATQIAGLTTVTKIAAGGAHSIALMSNGQAKSWGSNTAGQLGINFAGAYNSTPGNVALAAGVTTPLPSFTDIAAGGSHSIFLASDGTVWACGYNVDGQLGNGTIDNRIGVVPVSITGTVSAIAAGLDHSLALKSDGTVWAWGYNFYGQLGNGVLFTQPPNTSQTTPVQVMEGPNTPLTGVIKIVAIGNHNLAVDSSGRLWAWGDNAFGQLGIAVGDATPRSYATQVTTSTGLIAPVLYSP